MDLKLDGQAISDIIIGMSDGLTVPFALAAGLAALGQSHIVLIGGLSELAAGGISMGLGGYLAAKSQADTYIAKLRLEQRGIREWPDEEIEEVRQILASYGLQGEALIAAVQGIITNREGWARFMMREEIDLERPHPGQAVKTALFIGGAYMVGGIVPLAPYALGLSVNTALHLSIISTSVVLLMFGAIKGKLTAISPLKSAIETFMVGSVAAAAAYGLARAIAGR